MPVPDPRRSERLLGALLIAAIAAVFVNGLGAFPLQEPDEGRYADIAATMLRDGDWVTPHLNGIRYFEKPPLFFWTAAVSMAVFGANAWAARLPSALAALATCVVVLRWGARAAGARAGRIAALVLATTPLVLVLSHVVLVDVMLTLCIALALDAADRAFVARERDAPCSKRWTLAFFAFLGLATLVKGPIGLVLPFAAVAAFAAFARDRRALTALASPAGWLVAAAVVAPWCFAMERVNPGYLRDFLVGQNWQRLTTGGIYGRQQPAWYYLPILAAAWLPWTLFLPLAARAAWRAARTPIGESARRRLFLGAAIVGPFVVLSVAQSKLGYYLLPIGPPIAMLVALTLAGSERGALTFAGGELAAASAHDAPPRARSVSRLLLACGVMCMLAAGAIAAVGSIDAKRLRSIVRPNDSKKLSDVEICARITAAQKSAPAVASLIALVAAGAFAGAALAKREKPLAGVAAMGATLLACGFALPSVAGAASESFASANVVERIRQAARPGEPVVLYTDYLRAVPFALGRPVWIWSADASEFGHDVSEEEASGRSFLRSADALKRLLQESPSVLIVDDRHRGVASIDLLASAPLELVEQVGRYRILRSRGSDSPPR